MRRSLWARITLVLVAMTVTLAVVSAVAIASLTHLGGAIATILRENQASVLACEDMLDALDRQDDAARLAATDPDAAPRLLEARRAWDHAFGVEAHNVTLPGESERVREMAAVYLDQTVAVDRALAAGDAVGRTAALAHEVAPRVARLRAIVQRVLRMNQSHMEAADAAARALAHRSVVGLLAVVAVAIVMALLSIWRLPALLVRPARALADVARSIGEGSLDLDVAEPDMRELVPLADAFRRMLSQLRAYRASSLGELLAAKDLANATVACQLDPVVVFGRADDILLTNEAAERTFGLRPGEMAALEGEDVTVPDFFVAVRDRVFGGDARVAPRSLSEAVRWRDRWFLLRAAPLRTGEDGVRGAIVVAEDVTRLRRIDALKSDMVATVSHEFKTPLTSLRMATHLLLEPASGPLDASQREVVTMARDETERLRALVDKLLDLVRIETEAGALHIVPFDARTLLERVLSAHRAIAADKGVALEVDTARASPSAVDADPEKLDIVLSNLVSNAIRHTPAGGRVALFAAGDEATLRIGVRDTGEGMAQDEVARWLANDGGARGGANPPGRHGLGLTIAHEIVLQHGGELRLDSAPGSGSTFTVVLPRHGGAAAS